MEIKSNNNNYDNNNNNNQALAASWTMCISLNFSCLKKWIFNFSPLRSLPCTRTCVIFKKWYLLIRHKILRLKMNRNTLTSKYWFEIYGASIATGLQGLIIPCSKWQDVIRCFSGANLIVTSTRLKTLQLLFFFSSGSSAWCHVCNKKMPTGCKVCDVGMI